MPDNELDDEIGRLGRNIDRNTRDVEDARKRPYPFDGEFRRERRREEERAEKRTKNFPPAKPASRLGDVTP